MRTLVVAPHPDDELLGCGGTLLRRSVEGATIGWMIVTTITEHVGWSADRSERREWEIEHVRKELGIAPENLFRLGLPTTRLDAIPMSDVINKMSSAFHSFEPEQVLLPHRGDLHTDHRVTFDAVAACAKWFRYPSVKQVLAYETVSETDFSLESRYPFIPNVYVNIGGYLDRKVELLQTYRSEMGQFPFPRSEQAVRALAAIRGSAAGYDAAEAFLLLRQRID